MSTNTLLSIILLRDESSFLCDFGSNKDTGEDIDSLLISLKESLKFIKKDIKRHLVFAKPT
jgi:hypothetical protein